MPWRAHSGLAEGCGALAQDLFVYGTLQPGLATPMARWIEARTLAVRRASADGDLYALRDPRGWYPALVAGGGRVVHGMLVKIAVNGGALAHLDRYEGRDYRRRSLHVRSDGRTVAAQAWLWQGALPRGARRVQNGDFVTWIAASGRRCFR